MTPSKKALFDSFLTGFIDLIGMAIGAFAAGVPIGPIGILIGSLIAGFIFVPLNWPVWTVIWTIQSKGLKKPKGAAQWCLLAVAILLCVIRFPVESILWLALGRLLGPPLRGVLHGIHMGVVVMVATMITSYYKLKVPQIPLDWVSLIFSGMVTGLLSFFIVWGHFQKDPVPERAGIPESHESS